MRQIAIVHPCRILSEKGKIGQPTHFVEETRYLSWINPDTDKSAMVVFAEVQDLKDIVDSLVAVYQTKQRPVSISNRTQDDLNFVDMRMDLTSFGGFQLLSLGKFQEKDCYAIIDRATETNGSVEKQHFFITELLGYRSNHTVYSAEVVELQDDRRTDEEKNFFKYMNSQVANIQGYT